MASERPSERPIDDDVPARAPEGLRIGRAAFLGTIAVGLGGILVAPLVSSPFNAVSDLFTGGGWRIYTVASTMPTFDPATYRLSISGLVRRPAALPWREVAAIPGESRTADFHCVTGWTVRGVHWEGIPGRTLLDLARPAPTARYLTLVSMEHPYVDQIGLDQLALPGVMLARQMDGRPLAREHGAPLRLVIPQMYGYKNVKWVGELRFDAQPMAGYWEQQGYDVDAWVGRSNGYTS